MFSKIIIVFSSGLMVLALLSHLSLANEEKNDPPLTYMEVANSWQKSRVYIPTSSGGNRITLSQLLEKMEDYNGQRLPVAVYLHGCAGLWFGSDRRALFLTKLGFIVIAPDSFARPSKKTSCIPSQLRGGLFRGTLIERQEEAAYALSSISQIPWVDTDQILMIGFSEGGNTVATLNENILRKIRARVIEGWGCNAGWIEYHGLSTTHNQPVLSLLGAQDPWFRHPSLQGDCSEYMKNDESLSIVYKNTPLNTVHNLLDWEEPKKDLSKFLCKYFVCSENILLLEKINEESD